MARELDTSAAHARRLDAGDPLSATRGRFHLPEGIYLNGNSLGALCRDAEEAVLEAISEWRRFGVEAWVRGESGWVDLAERVGRLVAPMVGAQADDVIATGTTTVNIHALVATFFAPVGRRDRILADALTFPSDLYALSSHLELRGLDPDTHLIRAGAADGRFLDEDALIAAMTDEVALVFLPSVLYRSGQLLDMRRLTQAAHERGILIGFDCSHSAGAVRHELDRWGVDFALWCGYKHLCGGPGCTAFIYVNRAHHERVPAMVGWWGSDKRRLMDMLPRFHRAPGAAAWQISTPPILSLAPLLGSLRVIGEAGVDAIREKSLRQTDYLMSLLDALVPEAETGVVVGTPRSHDGRGPHVAVEFADAAGLHSRLQREGVIADLRPPDVLRFSPAFYNTYEEVWKAARVLRASWRSWADEKNGG